VIALVPPERVSFLSVIRPVDWAGTSVTVLLLSEPLTVFYFPHSQRSFFVLASVLPKRCIALTADGGVDAFLFGEFFFLCTSRSLEFFSLRL